jgi:hypothetical protein
MWALLLSILVGVARVWECATGRALPLRSPHRGRFSRTGPVWLQEFHSPSP